MKKGDAKQLKDFLPYARSTRWWYRPLGFFYQSFAVVAGVFLFCLVGFGLKPVHIPSRIIQIFLGLASLLFAYIFYVGGQLRIDTKKLLLDFRQPIIYLRPFSHERLEVLYESSMSLPPFFRMILEIISPGYSSSDTIDTNDATLAKAFDEIGPMVTVGMPDQSFSPSGAIRLYFENEEWQERVKELMKISRMVIIQPGYSSYIDWELKTIQQYFLPEQIYISFVDWASLNKKLRRSKFEETKGQLKKTLNISLPDDFVDSHFIYFDSNWKPIKVKRSWWIKIVCFPSEGCQPQL